MKLTPEWISGFVDGNGCFSTQPGVEGCATYFRFTCSQNKESADVLYALKKHFACGTVRFTCNNLVEYAQSNPLHLRDKCIPFFEKYPLQTEKKYKFYKWATDVRTSLEKAAPETANHKCIASARNPGEYQLSAGWFRGIVDVNGCFSLLRVGDNLQPRFLLGVMRDKELLDQCRVLIKCGIRYTGRDGMEILEVSALQDLEKKVFPFFETRGSAVLLRTTKRIAFQKFRKIVRLMGEKRNHTDAGREKIEKLLLGLNQIQEKINSTRKNCDPQIFPL